MAVIKNLFILGMGEASSKNGIYTTSIQCIVEDKIVFRMVTNAAMIITRYSRLKNAVFGDE